jgi:aminopeptidase N
VPTADQPIKRPLLVLLEMGLLDKNGHEYPFKVKGNKTRNNDKNFLKLSRKTQNFVFEGISSEPVLALLRGFSSPVKLKVELSSDDLSILMTQEKDSFVRWNAAQEYAERLILEIVETKQYGKKIRLDENYVRAIKEILLNEDLEPALRAELLRIPSESDLSQKMKIIDVEGIHAARRYFIFNLGDELYGSFNDVFHKIMASMVHCDLSTKAMGARSLVATCLGYLSASGSLDSLKLALAEVVSANSMTLTMAGLNALNDVDCNEREEALRIFYQRWHNKPLELDKWFSLNASSTLPNTLEKVKQLTGHKSYDLGNPNRIRALVGTFASNNPVNFHRKGGIGYKILTDTVISLNSINPQIGARLVGPLTKWKRHNGVRKKLMLNQLNRVIEHENLSKDIFEIVSKALIKH